MARARNIKPGFFTNEILGDLDPLTRLLFIGLWTLADREGRLEDRPKKIKAELLPYDNADVDSMLSSLEKSGFIIRYIANDKRYIQVSSFSKHQAPHHKEVASVIPAPLMNDVKPLKNNDIVINEPSLSHDHFMHESSINQAISNQIASCPTDSLNLIPDSLNLIPDSKNDTPELRKCSAGDPVNPENKIIGDVSKKPLKQTQGYEYPERLNLQAWSEWLEYRKENRIKPYKKTKTGELAVINNLLEMSGGDPSIQDQIVKQSIGQNWQGLFPLKNIRPIQNGMAQTNIQAAQQAAQRAKASGIGSYDDNTVF